MNTERFVIADEVWEKVSPHLPGKATDCGVTAADNRLFLEAVLWRVRTGSPWRDLPVAFGNWNSVFQRFRRWAKIRCFQAAVRGSIGGTGLRIRPHRRHHRQRSPEGERRKGGTQNQAIGRSRGGLTTKIVALVDALGNLARFVLLPGQRHDTIGVAALIQDVHFDALLGDKAFDVDWLREELDQRGATAVIPPKANRNRQIAYNILRSMGALGP